MAVQPAAPSTIPGAFSGAALRADFPVFERLTGTGKRLVFLDAAASAPKPQVVIDGFVADREPIVVAGVATAPYFENAVRAGSMVSAVVPPA